MKLITSISFMFLAMTVVAQDEEAQNMHGRVSFAEDSGLIKGTSDEDWSFAALNSLVMPGDQIWADEEGVLELEFSGGTFVRLADGSRLEVVETPPTAVFQGWQGSFFIQRMSRSTGEVRFETPVGYVLIDQNSQVRIDILKEGATTVSVRWGSAIFTDTEGRSFRVGPGKRVYVDPGYSPSEPTAFDRNLEDSFDQWNRDRARSIAIGSEYMPVLSNSSNDTPIGMRDLNDYGEWIYDDSRYFWRPTVVTDYVPYRNGSWSFVPSQGHVWVGNYPFSYITSHHGFWHYHNAHGWIWAYNGAYAPAYAATVRYGDRFVWAPLGLNGQVAYYGNDYFVAAGIRFGYGLATWAYVDHVLHGHHTVYVYDHHHHHHYHNNYINVHYWNLHDHHHHRRHGHHYRPYDDHRYNQPARDYSPRRVMRGSDKDRARTRSARDTADRLQTRNSSLRDNLRVGGYRDKSGLRTPLSSRTREAKVRDIRIRPEATDRSINRGTTIGTRTIQRKDPRTGRDRTTVTTRNDDTRTRSTRPTPITTGNDRIRNNDLKKQTVNRTPSTTDRSNTRSGLPSTTDRSNTRSGLPSEEGRWTRPEQGGTDRSLTRGQSDRSKANVTTRQPLVSNPPVADQNRTTRKQVTTPQTNRQPSVSTRPNGQANRSTRTQTTSPRVSTRQPTLSTPPTRTVNRPTRTQATSPRVNTRQPTSSTPPTSTINRPTRTQVSAPRVITRQPSTPQVNTRRPTTISTPRVNTRQPSTQQRQVSTPTRSYSPPSTSSRSSSPSRSYSAPSTSSRSSSPSRSYSAPSTSSRSSSPSVSSRSSSSSSRSSSSSGGSSRGGRVR